MDVYETRVRGLHIKAVENIMKRRVTMKNFRSAPRDRPNATCTIKSDCMIACFKKLQIEKENLQLAQRIMMCDSGHDHKKYQMEWKKNEHFSKVRSNFRRNLSTQEPRQFKISQISGFGSLLVRLRLLRIVSRPICLKSGNQYSLMVHSKRHQPIRPTSNIFDVTSMPSSTMAFYLPKMLEAKKLCGKIQQLKENKIMFKGKFYFKPSQTGIQQVQIFNKTSEKTLVQGYNKKKNNSPSNLQRAIKQPQGLDSLQQTSI